MGILGGAGAQGLLATRDSQTPQIGDILDSRYRITGVLGSGGMGCVYLAEHVSIQRPLALKLLHPEVEDIDEMIKRFEREAFAIGRMDHPNCVNVSDFGKLSDGTFYMVLELLDGVLLFDLLERETRVDWKRALHIGRHLLSALDYAHDAGIIHRDVKPENVILVEQDGDPDFAKILDFGIAKLLHDDAKPESDTLLLVNDAKLTQQGVAIGTPTYIAPEQAYGLPIDGRADLYSLSVMLYEMITGVPPFDTDDVGALLRMHVSQSVPRFADVAPDVDVPDAVERLILHGLEKKPDDRIGSAKDYIQRIDKIVRGKDRLRSGLREIPPFDIHRIRALLTTRFARVVPKKKPTKRMLAAAIVVIALTAGLALAFGSTGPDTPAPEEPYAVMSLGHAQANKELSMQALIAYEKALSLDPELANNKRMRANVERMLDKKSPPDVVDAALDFLGMLVSTAGDQTAADQLIDFASSSKEPRRRHKAVKVAEEVGLSDRIDRLDSYTLDLQQGETCPDRKEAVANLRALGSKKAIPALRKARNRPRGGLGRKRVNTNACLRGSANEAIQYLQRL
ncbi:MAG: serine/threonine protein kinase [Myxococcales bacterium]|nr:serine/threonine protein kinase [Myxococcales bacterium]MDH3483762.1 serine/threonine protein kinase [Myxococcales bacterium]